MPDSIPPWDRLPHFFTPVETTVSVGVTPVQIAKGDPMRVLLVIGMGGLSSTTTTISYPIPIAFASVNVATTVAPIVISTSGLAGVIGGYQINPVSGPFVMDVRNWGAAVALPWFARGTIGSPPLTILTLSMRDWPEDQQLPDNLIQQTDKGVNVNDTSRRTSGASAAKLYTNRWTQRAPDAPYSLSDILKPGFRPFGIPRKP